MAQSMASLLECPICLDAFKDPRMLTSCLHTLCFKCLGDHITHCGRNGQFQCPVCRKFLQIPEDGPDSFPKNFFVNTYMDAHLVTDKGTGARSKTCKTQSGGQNRGRGNNCSNYEDGGDCTQPEHFCQDCCEYYCKTCSRVHRKSKLSRSHSQIALDDLTQDMLRDAMSKSETPRCQKHKDKMLELYCSTCQTPVCYLCSQINHQSHQFREVSDVDAELKFELGELITTLQGLINDGEAKQVQVNESHQVVESSTSTARKTNNDVFQKMQRMLTLKAEQIDQDIDKISQESRANTNAQNKTMTLRTQLLESLHIFAIDLLKAGTVYNRLASLPDVRSRLQDYVASASNLADGAKNTKKLSSTNLVAKHLDGLVMTQEVKLDGPGPRAGPILEIKTSCSIKQQVSTQRKDVGLASPRSEKPKNADGLYICHRILKEVPFKEIELSRRSFEFTKKLGNAKWRNQVDVAVKTLHTGQVPTEAILMHKLRHRKLVQLLGVCTVSQTIFIITELMVNGSLLEYLRTAEGRKIQLKDMIDMAAQIADGMAYIGEQACVHRELMAANIMVGENNTVKVAITDTAVELADDAHMAAGTFQIKWTAPEAAFDCKFSVKSDVWSFGVLLYELVTFGEVPYADMTSKTMLKIIERDYRLPRPVDERSKCPKELYDVMTSTWQKSPEHRPTFDYLKKIFDNWFLQYALLSDHTVFQ